MRYTIERQWEIFERTSGRCHICRRRLAWSNYGALGARGAWEVEHSIPRAVGGTDHLNNLYPAHITCNRSKGAGSTRSARAVYGYTSAPLSAPRAARARRENAGKGALVAGGVALLIGVAPPVALVLAGLGALAGHEVDPNA
jgi:hypothetical protein